MTVSSSVTGHIFRLKMPLSGFLLFNIDRKTSRVEFPHQGELVECLRANLGLEANIEAFYPNRLGGRLFGLFHLN